MNPHLFVWVELTLSRSESLVFVAQAETAETAEVVAVTVPKNICIVETRGFHLRSFFLHK